MVTWQEFADINSELAEVGRGLLYQFGVGLAFLATVRKDGGPRLHPVCPFISNGHLYVLIGPTTPKKNDLMRDGRYALQTFPPPRKESEEFYMTGRAELIGHLETRTVACAEAKHFWKEDELLFELKIETVMHTTWENWGTPEIRPIHEKWQMSTAVD